MALFYDPPELPLFDVVSRKMGGGRSSPSVIVHDTMQTDESGPSTPPIKAKERE